MAAPTAIDVATRTTMADSPNFISKAVPKKRRGVFKEKAQAAGKTTREFAAEKKDAPGALGKEARLASTLMGMNKSAGHKAALYTRKKG